MPSPTRPAVRRLASALAATALLTGGIAAGTGTAAAGLPVTDVCGGPPPCVQPPTGSAAVGMEALAFVVLPVNSWFAANFTDAGSLDGGLPGSGT
ncbi:hypothetical protein [Rhodococcus tukisamuensis]|uniref:Uncharacterized protein n=1 Tax=Rhodococcus tukisamuensis TaxID=168276 RepID=A0A1G6YK33_9NOCA|nr:hypothetical protein [Rhodococcus tukisamuensis]SDD89926.1 hypothetical protein SAMN05444580_107188 [Rhodococcus tukisamuensis]